MTSVVEMSLNLDIFLYIYIYAFSERSEPNWKLNAVVSTLSTGPVGPSDMIGGTNVDMLMM